MGNITGVPEENAEYLQLLRYEKTQHYHVHNDYIDHVRSWFRCSFARRRNVIAFVLRLSMCSPMRFADFSCTTAITAPLWGPNPDVLLVFERYGPLTFPMRLMRQPDFDLTLHLVLSLSFHADVEEGGETSFPNLGLKVKPKLGRAALWPSVLNDQPNTRDSRTDHTALPVIKGLKYAANAWFHQRDFKGPLENNCS